jgi:hypothetical protein
MMRYKVGAAIGILIVVAGLTYAIAVSKAKVSHDQKPFQRPVATVSQLPVENGIIPVEIQREKVHLLAPNQIEDVYCTVVNNTNKGITAVTVAYAVEIVQNGKESTAPDYLTFDTIVHPDIQAIHGAKPVAPGSFRVVENGGTTFDPSAEVKGIQLSIDYVQFEDGTSIGPNKQGERIIASMRNGAAKYKAWLKDQYDKNSKSASAILPLLGADKLPADIQYDNTFQRQGAMIYRIHLRQHFEHADVSRVEQILN